MLFEAFLLRLCNQENADNDFELLQTKCSYCAMRHNEQIEKDFEDNETINVFATNLEDLAHNNQKILNVGNLIALVKSKNARKDSLLSKDNFNGLTLSVCMCVGSKVVLIKIFTS